MSTLERPFSGFKITPENHRKNTGERPPLDHTYLVGTTVPTDLQIFTDSICMFANRSVCHRPAQRKQIENSNLRPISRASRDRRRSNFCDFAANQAGKPTKKPARERPWRADLITETSVYYPSVAIARRDQPSLAATFSMSLRSFSA